MDSTRQRASPEQFGVLIEFMERHGDLSRPQAGPQGRVRCDRLWGELTSLINSIGGGVEKTQDKWKKILSQPREAPTTKSERSEIVLDIPDINIAPSPEPPSAPPLILTATTSSPPHPSTPLTPPPPPRTPQRNTDRLTPLVSPQTAAGSPRRWLLRGRRNRGLTPFDRAVSEFVAIEQSRLRLEETRDRRYHERETESLRLEAERINVAREQNLLLRQLTQLLQILSQGGSLPSTVVTDIERNEDL